MAFAHYFYLDFETRSMLDVKRVGAYRYAEDPSTEPLCASWAVDDGNVCLWRAGFPPTWLAICDRPDVLIVAHNAEFEREILAQKFGRRYPPSKFRCTAAQCAAMSLPRKLETAGNIIGLEHLKKAGGHLINKFSKPRKASKDNPDQFWTRETAPEEFAEFEDYNIGDTEAERELHQLLPPLSEREQKLWELTVEMNESGIRLDTEAVGWMEQAAFEESKRLTAEWLRLTGVKPSSKGAAVAVGLKSLAKLAVRQALRRRDLPPQVREALKVRQMLARTSLRKLPTMRAQLCADGKLRGAMVFGGAERTNRWAGGGVQLHNFPRGLSVKKMPDGSRVNQQTEAFELLARGALHLVYDDVLRTLSDMLKGLLTGPWLIGDYGQIEARDLAWLAGDKKLLQDFANGVDIYCDMASVIYGTKITPDDYDPVLKVAKRQLGKMAILGCGYGMGAKKFQAQAEKDYDVLLDEATAKKAVASYRKRFGSVVALWNLLERGMVQAIESRANRLQIGPVRMGTRDIHGRHFTYIELPSGRSVFYLNPKVDEAKRISYEGRNILTHQWERIESYGGRLTENTDQADSRDLLAHSMLELKAAGFRMAWTVHDENVAYDDGQKDALPEFERIMKKAPEWHEGIPLSVEAFQSWRYRK